MLLVATCNEWEKGNVPCDTEIQNCIVGFWFLCYASSLLLSANLFRGYKNSVHCLVYLELLRTSADIIIICFTWSWNLLAGFHGKLPSRPHCGRSSWNFILYILFLWKLVKAVRFIPSFILGKVRVEWHFIFCYLYWWANMRSCDPIGLREHYAFFRDVCLCIFFFVFSPSLSLSFSLICWHMHPICWSYKVCMT